MSGLRFRSAGRGAGSAPVPGASSGFNHDDPHRQRVPPGGFNPQSFDSVVLLIRALNSRSEIQFPSGMAFARRRSEGLPEFRVFPRFRSRPIRDLQGIAAPRLVTTRSLRRVSFSISQPVVLRCRCFLTWARSMTPSAKPCRRGRHLAMSPETSAVFPACPLKMLQQVD